MLSYGLREIWTVWRAGDYIISRRDGKVECEGIKRSRGARGPCAGTSRIWVIDSPYDVRLLPNQ